MKNLVLNEGYLNSDKFFAGGSGSKIIYKGKKYLDLSCCAGTLLLGHNSKIYKKTLNEITKENITPLAIPNLQANNFAKLLKKIITYKHKFIFCNSGTEAITKSLRLSFALSKKNLILATTGSWHGSVDNLLFYPGKNLQPNPLSGGILKTHKKNLRFLPYNDIKKSKKIIMKYRNKVSCIVVEPIQGCLPMEEAKDYLKFLREISKKNNILLIFDELITGLRTNGSTLQNYFKIKPDISTFGKCFGGGLPIGIIGITKEIYSKLPKKEKKVFFGGTFSANSVSTYLGMKTTNYIFQNKSKIFSKIEKNAKFFQEEMNKFFKKEIMQAKIYRFKSQLRIVYTDRKVVNRIQRDFFETSKLNKVNSIIYFLFKKKIYYPKNGLIFFSEQTSTKDIKYFIKNLKFAFKKFY